ncbi:alpha/beta hydrolase fold domain-containing protein [Rhizobium sp. CFBP 8752]|uniref:alpha/beta hydrolase n=1 Tax=Rhizobium sp. CFBP 8752 TaxID=2775301 RepID=UPI001782F48E|nr:alpha/beta hydrolase [Rhizobium sp. CFBP 8752]MBD8663277.1 alpha/beta hydrolase fold domain-containing protein [Rhizobium sp. CFBP 8752]
MTDWNKNADIEWAGLSVSIHRYEGQPAAKVAPIILYLRGSAFQQGGLRDREVPIGKVFSEAGSIVVEADYGAASGNLFPQAMEFAFAALTYLSSNRKRFGSARSPLFVAGDEAGGNVAAGVALKARDQLPGELRGQILLSPMIDPMMASKSFRRADEIGMREKWSDGWSHYLRAACGFQHPYAAPGLCSRLSGLAPALVVTSEDDPLHDEVVNYADRLEASGVSVRQKIFPKGAGWTGVYKGGQGNWMAGLSAEFKGFVETLSE